MNTRDLNLQVLDTLTAAGAPVTAQQVLAAGLALAGDESSRQAWTAFTQQNGALLTRRINAGIAG